MHIVCQFAGLHGFWRMFLSFKHWMQFSLWIVFLPHKVVVSAGIGSEVEAELLCMRKHKASIKRVRLICRCTSWWHSLRTWCGAWTVEPSVSQMGKWGRKLDVGWEQEQTATLMNSHKVSWNPQETIQSPHLSLTTSYHDAVVGRSWCPSARAPALSLGKVGGQILRALRHDELDEGPPQPGQLADLT